MNNQTQTTQDTKVGTSVTSSTKVEAKSSGPTRDELNQFTDAVAIAKANYIPGAQLPCIEVPRSVIEHFNKRNLSAFDEVGYFVYSDVRVFEEGRMEAGKAKDNQSVSQKLFGKEV